MRFGIINDNTALALLRWNHLNPPSRVEAWITLGILVGGTIWAFGRSWSNGGEIEDKVRFRPKANTYRFEDHAGALVAALSK